MTIDPDKNVKATAIKTFSRVESSAPAGKPLKDHGIDVCPRPGAVPAGRDEKRRTIEEREEEMVALARAHILTCGDFLLVQGKRPQDLLSTEPSRVISAAHEEANGVMHG